MKYIDLSKVSEVGSGLAPGGYICKITKVEDFPDREFLKIEYDISHGQFTGYFLKLWQNKHFWGGSFIKSYKEAALPFFKGFKTAVENSNQGFKFDGENEQSFVGKFVGLILGEEEYRSNSGEVKKRIYVDEVRSIQSIKEGDFKVPELKKLRAETTHSYSQPPNESSGGNDGFYPIDPNSDECLPF